METLLIKRFLVSLIIVGLAYFWRFSIPLMVINLALPLVSVWWPKTRVIILSIPVIALVGAAVGWVMPNLPGASSTWILLCLTITLVLANAAVMTLNNPNEK